ncbi:hypothetical protein ABZS95_43605 [Streptomyces sp. NPDC005479]
MAPASILQLGDYLGDGLWIRLGAGPHDGTHLIVIEGPELLVLRRA